MNYFKKNFKNILKMYIIKNNKNKRKKQQYISSAITSCPYLLSYSAFSYCSNNTIRLVLLSITAIE